MFYVHFLFVRSFGLVYVIVLSFVLSLCSLYVIFLSSLCFLLLYVLSFLSVPLCCTVHAVPAHTSTLAAAASHHNNERPPRLCSGEHPPSAGRGRPRGAGTGGPSIGEGKVAEAHARAAAAAPEKSHERTTNARELLTRARASSLRAVL